ncbi:hypothetical protein GCM10010495_48840 [Kitasatospora herbaricolor]|nr:hypothetical protein GCM10010495_48840 [Kitasatospora herbaricolor]
MRRASLLGAAAPAVGPTFRLRDAEPANLATKSRAGHRAHCLNQPIHEAGRRGVGLDGLIRACNSWRCRVGPGNATTRTGEAQSDDRIDGALSVGDLATLLHPARPAAAR